MTMHRYRLALLRVLLTCLFCAAGYGLMRLPATVAAFRQDHGRLISPPPAAKNAAPASTSGPAAAIRPPDKAAATPIAQNPVAAPEAAPLVETLKTVIDPELGINIVDLGLIRQIDDPGTGRVTITMIPTSPLCPFLKQLVAEIKKTVREQTSCSEVRVTVDMQQRWTPDHLTAEGRRHFFGSKP